MNNIKHIQDFGQSIWLDFIDRKILQTGVLKKMIDEDGIRGVTSNPAIFAKSFADSNDYENDIQRAVLTETDNEALFYNIAIADIQRAADLFRPLYEEQHDGASGYVSLEVSPLLAQDAVKTLEQAKALWAALERPNVLIKIPATEEGLKAIRQCIAQGIHVNVTLIFSLDRYKKVVESYLSGLEDRVRQGLSIHGISSVASFFLSRIDSMVDPVLRNKGLDQLVGHTAISLAKAAYAIYQEQFSGSRFKHLQKLGAQTQQLLWASTGTKDPAFEDVKYMEALIGENTINTVPVETLQAFRDHGQAASRLEQDLEGALNNLQSLREGGIDLNAIAAKLEEDGLQKFNEPYNKLMELIGEQRAAVTRHAAGQASTDHTSVNTATAVLPADLSKSIDEQLQDKVAGEAGPALSPEL